jgi:hypothetical protein
MRYKLVAPALLILFGAATMLPAWAKTVLTPGPKPTQIEPGREPFTFATPPTILTSFSCDEPFLEGEIAYGYTGRVVTPVQSGSDIVAPAGSAAYGVPMQVFERNNMSGKIEVFPRELVWCAVTRDSGSIKVRGICLFNEGLGGGGHDSLMTSNAGYIDRDPYGGGEIASAPFDLGAPVHVRYFVQNLGKIARIKAQILLGNNVANEWGFIFGDIGRGAQPDERLFSIGGGEVGIRPSPEGKGHYKLRIVLPLKATGSAGLGEVRNDSRATGVPSQRQ